MAVGGCNLPHLEFHHERLGQHLDCLAHRWGFVCADFRGFLINNEAVIDQKKTGNVETAPVFFFDWSNTN